MSLAGVWNAVVAWVFDNLLNPVGIQPADLSWAADRIPQFFAVLVLFYLLARGIVWALSKTFLRPSRVDPMLTQLVNRLLFAAMMFVGVSVGLRVFGINVFNLAITLGLVGAGLALGLQNSVANVMGGISLVSDRPFEVGDRVQIGELWGDVEEIGLRSTRILTVRREYVIIPNRLMDEREIWNYTKRYPELRLDIDTEISYESDVELARQLMLDVAEDHPDVLSFPQPRALNHEFLDSGVRMQMRCFISDARDQYNVASDLRDGMKEAFQENGVEIPYPYRTLVDKADLPEPAQAADVPQPRHRLGPRRVLVAVAGSAPAIRKAKTVVEFCDQLDADILLAHFSKRPSIVSEREGEMAADVYEAKAQERGVRVRLVTEAGSPQDALPRVAERERCGAVVIGAPRRSMFSGWGSSFGDDLRDRLDVPLIVVEDDLSIDPHEIEAARRSLDAIEEAEESS